MDPKELQELRELIEFLKANEIAEFDLEKNDLKVRLKFLGAIKAETAAAPSLDMAQLARLMASAPAPSSSVPAVQPGTAATLSGAVADPAPIAPAEKLHTVKSPMVGTFYESPSPGASSFVKIGDLVEVGQTLCIVEAMKLMNEIESDAAGEIVERLPSGGQPVEYGQPLFTIRPR